VEKGEPRHRYEDEGMQAAIMLENLVIQGHAVREDFYSMRGGLSSHQSAFGQLVPMNNNRRGP
jgi:hypothetical protein